MLRSIGWLISCVFGFVLNLFFKLLTEIECKAAGICSNRQAPPVKW